MCLLHWSKTYATFLLENWNLKLHLETNSLVVCELSDSLHVYEYLWKFLPICLKYYIAIKAFSFHKYSITLKLIKCDQNPKPKTLNTYLRALNPKL